MLVYLTGTCIISPLDLGSQSLQQNHELHVVQIHQEDM